ncbi:hypothetical protein ACI2KR_07410 [Pseudomonas luteola]
MQKKIITLTGISCSGKSTLASFLTNHTEDMTEAVSTTTRPPRAGEANGINYYFVPENDFLALEAENALLESVTFGSNRYGLSIKEMDRIFSLGKTPVVVVEPYGAEEIAKNANNFGISAINVFISCPLGLALKRWHMRFMKDLSEGIDNTDFYAKRIALTITDEQFWKSSVNYHMVIPYANTEDQTLKQSEMLRESLRNHPDQLKLKKEHAALDSAQTKESVLNLLKAGIGTEEFIRVVGKNILRNDSLSIGDLAC